jgi:hypothetical protein
VIELQLINGKWCAVKNGKILFKSATKYYTKKKIEQLESECEESTSPSTVAFPINQRFEFVSDLVEMVATQQTPSCIITGEGGLGKSHTVTQTLEKIGLTDVSEIEAGIECPPGTYRVIKGYSTAKGLYRILYENKDGIIVFDDCDSILKDPDALNILKGALDSYSKRLITWNTSVDTELPRSFCFNGGIIFISNLSPEKLDQALKSRSMNVDLTMTLDQKIDRMKFIIEEPSFLPNVPMASKFEALEVVDRYKQEANEISLRSLITVCKIKQSGKSNWQDLAKYMLVN